MYKVGQKLVCIKDLYFVYGNMVSELSFKKGKEYEIKHIFRDGKMDFISEQDELHSIGPPVGIGTWYHYFKVTRKQKLERILNV